MNPDVDVVVPCYNYARYLPACIDSVLGQEGVNVRALVIDDASTDDSAEVAARLAAANPRVEFHRHLKNRGHIDTYNEGLLDWARARYSVLLSADDLLAPGALGRAVHLMDSNPAVGMTYGMARTFSDHEIPNASTVHVSTSQVIPGARYVQRVCARGNAVPTPTAVVRTALQQQLGGYRKDLPHSGDMEMWLRFAINGPLGIINAIQAFYRMHSASMSTQYYANAIRDRREQLRACAEACEHSKGAIPEFAGWLEGMAKRLSEECFWAGSSAFDRGELDTTRKCLDHAIEFNPAIANTIMWKKMRLKRIVGPSGWRVVRRLLAESDRKSAMVTLPSASPNSGQKIGWWPEPLES